MALTDFISRMFGRSSQNGVVPSRLPGSTPARQTAARNEGNPRPDPLTVRGPSGRQLNVDWEAGEDHESAIPQVLTYAAIIGTAYRTYVQDRWDEAIKHDREDAQVMWRDCWLQALLGERIREVTRRKWHLAIEDDRDPVQVGVRDVLTKALKRTPYLKKFLRCLMLDRWYGRYANQCVYQWEEIDGERLLTVKSWQPLNGDKLAFQFDGTPAVAVHGGITDSAYGDGAEYVITTIGRALLLKGTWRHRFIISKHEIDDGDYFDPESAPTVMGVGIRHRIFWLDWLRREFLGWVINYMERVGQGLTIWFYDDSNPAARAEAEAAAKLQSSRMNIVWPRGRQSNSGSGVERIEVPVQGSQFLVLLQQNIEEKIERYIVGQKLSADHRGSGGLGGSGAADFQRDTKKQIGDDDACNIAESMTGNRQEPGLVWIMKEASFPWADFPVSFEFEEDPVDSVAKLEAVQLAFGLGVDFVKDEVRALTGLSKPDPQDDVVGQMQNAVMAAQMGMGPDGSPLEQPGEEEEGGDEPMLGEMET